LLEGRTGRRGQDATSDVGQRERRGP